MKKIFDDKKTLIIFIVSMVFFIVAITVNFYILYDKARNNLITNKEIESMYEAIDINDFLLESIDTVRVVGGYIDNLQASNASDEQILDYLTRSTDAYSDYLDSSFTGLYGVFGGHYLDGAGWVPEKGWVAEERPWYIAAREADGEITLVTPYVDSQTHTVMMSISQLLADKKSAVSLDISLDSLQTRTESNAANNIWKYSMIIDSDGFVVTHSDIDEIGKYYSDKCGDFGEALYERIKGVDRLYTTVEYNGVKYAVFSAMIGGEWYCINVVEKKVMYGSLVRVYFMFVITLLVVIILITHVFVIVRKRQHQVKVVTEELAAVANTYKEMMLINIPKDSYSEISVGEDRMNISLIDKHEKAQNTLRVNMDAITDERFKKGIFEFISLDTLDERLQDKKAIQKEFINNRNHKCCCRFVPVVRANDGRIEKVIWIVEVVDDAGTVHV